MKVRARHRLILDASRPALERVGQNARLECVDGPITDARPRAIQHAVTGGAEGSPDALVAGGIDAPRAVVEGRNALTFVEVPAQFVDNGGSEGRGQFLSCG